MLKKIKYILLACVLLASMMLSACGGHTHEFEGWEYGENYHWQPCTDETCSSKNNYAKHVYGEDNVFTPSCTVGTVCNVCGADSSAIAEHVWDDGKVTARPTPAESGRLTHTCKVCDATKTTDLAPVNIYLPEVPFSIRTSGGSTFSITDMYPTYSTDEEDEGFVITIIGTKSADDKGYQNNSYCSISWKLYDEDDIVATSGVYTSPSIIVGEVFMNTFLIEVDTTKIYRLEISK